jgi:hypothetical protein
MTDTTAIVERLYKEMKPLLAKDIVEIVSSALAVQDHAHTGLDGTSQIKLDDIYVPVGNLIWRINTAGVGITWYPGSDAGFTAANAGASASDVILLPPKTFTNTLTITAGAKVVGWSRFTTTLSGQITGGAGSSLENLTITRAANDGGTLIGVISPAAGIFYITGCDIVCTQSGGGDCYAVSAEDNGTIIEIWNSYLYGNAGGGGTGYGARRDGGTSADMFVYDSRVRGSTAECSE